MKFPIEDIWLCPVNVGAHWILVVRVYFSKYIASEIIQDSSLVILGYCQTEYWWESLS